MRFLDGWDYEHAVEVARATKNPRERKALMNDAEALLTFQHAASRLCLRGLCVWCGAKMTGTPPRCYCRADD